MHLLQILSTSCINKINFKHKINSMQKKQFEDENLPHCSYAILSDCEKKIILIDPAGNPKHFQKMGMGIKL